MKEKTMAGPTIADVVEVYDQTGLGAEVRRLRTALDAANARADAAEGQRDAAALEAEEKIRALRGRDTARRWDPDPVPLDEVPALRTERVDFYDDGDHDAYRWHLRGSGDFVGAGGVTWAYVPKGEGALETRDRRVRAEALREGADHWDAIAARGGAAFKAEDDDAFLAADEERDGFGSWLRARADEKRGEEP